MVGEISDKENTKRRDIMSQDSPIPTRLLTPVPDPIPGGYFQRWQVYVDGVEVAPLHITMVNEEQGLQLDWGSHPDGKWSQFVYRENHGGGVVSIPHAVMPDGRVYIGVIDARRPFRDPRPGAVVMELPRGMRDKLESATQAAQRETEEETGHSASEGSYVVLDGAGANPNSTFWLTFDHEHETPDGVRFVTVEVPATSLVPSGDNEMVLDTAGPVDSFEGIEKCRFVPLNIRDIAGEGDMFLLNGAFKLQAYLIGHYTSVSFRDGVMVVSI